MGLYETSQLYLGLAAIVAFLTIIQYNRKKSTELAPEQQSALKPLYLMAIGILAYGIGALTIYLENDILGAAILFDTYMGYYAAAIVEVVILGYAAAMILKAKRFFIIPLSSLILSLILFGSAFVVEQTSEFLFVVGFVLPTYVLIFAGGLFVWIARGTQRSISAAFAFALLSQICGLPVLHFGFLADVVTGAIGIGMVLLPLMGPAMVVFAFMRPDQKISMELAGYGASYAGPAIILSGIQIGSISMDPFSIAIAFMGAVAVLLTLGTSAYLWGRYDESRAVPTLLFSICFLLLGVAHIYGMFGNFGMYPTPDAFYIEFILTGYALAILAVGAIYAAGWKSVGLVPLLGFVPISLLLAQAYPADVAATFMNLLYITIPMIAIMLLPAVIFMGVFLRMRTKGAPGRLKPFGIALGIILFFAIRLPPLIAGIGGLDYGYGLVFFSYLVSWSAMTGRLDKVAGTF